MINRHNLERQQADRLNSERLRGFDYGRTDRRTFASLELLSRLKSTEMLTCINKNPAIINLISNLDWKPIRELCVWKKIIYVKIQSIKGRKESELIFHLELFATLILQKVSKKRFCAIFYLYIIIFHHSFVH